MNLGLARHPSMEGVLCPKGDNRSRWLTAKPSTTQFWFCFVSHKRAALEPPLRPTETSQSHTLHEPGFGPFMHMHTELYPTPAGMHAADSNGLTGDVNCFQECSGGHPQSGM